MCCNKEILNYHMMWFIAVLFVWTMEQYNVVSKTVLFLIWVTLMSSSVWLVYNTSKDYFLKLYKSKYGKPSTQNSILYMDGYSKERSIIKIKEILITICISMFFYIGIKLQETDFYQFGLYMMSLSIYHYLEYCFWLMYHFEKVNPDSFLINQGKFYTLAISLSFVEYFIEIYLIPSLKLSMISTFFTICGIIITKIGHVFRVGAEFTAKSNFTHQIRIHKKAEHKLVTHGVYSISRHPGYFGWYLWSVGTQIMTWNPIWTIGFYFASYSFFKDRIETEEELLVEFFGDQYIEYRKRVPTRIPYID